ncbi:hypothetical protein DER44DRAFT_753318 [Fusarium oxysporum]|nr:hypothetical protein DER44DRAFT_753318 [Fusarium oxysporum]
MGKDKWAFQSAAWKEAGFTCVNLEEIHRQHDAYFIELLQKCRLGIPFTADEIATLMDHPHNVEKATKLLCAGREVAKVRGSGWLRMQAGRILAARPVNLDIKGGLFNGSQGIVCGFEEFDLKMFCI